MKDIALEPLLQDTTIKAIDAVARKLGRAERDAESTIAKMLAYWNDMSDTDKEQAAAIAIATISTAVSALVALRGKSKKPVKKAAKKLVREVAKKVG